MRLSRLLWDWVDDPFYRSQNEHAAATDSTYWRLVAWTGLLLSAVLVLLGTLDTGSLPLVGWYDLHCLAVSHFARRQAGLYARWRPPICLANWLHQGWTATQLALLASTDISVRSAPPMLTLLLVGTLNGSLFMLCSALRAPLLLWWNSLALPMAAAAPVWCSGAVCRLGLLQAPGAAVAVARLYRVLALTHIVAAVPGLPGWLALRPSPSVLHCCWMVNTWAVVTITVLLPWVRVWQRERHARRRFAWQQLLEAAGESGAAARVALPQAAPDAGGESAAREGRSGASIPRSALRLAMARDAMEAWGLADDCRPTWAWILDAYLLSCAAWAALLLYATARGI